MLNIQMENRKKKEEEEKGGREEELVLRKQLCTLKTVPLCLPDSVVEECLK